MHTLRLTIVVVLASVALSAAASVAWTRLNASELAVTAYIVPWDRDRGLRSLERHAHAITELSPVWYTPTDDGELVRNDESDTGPVVAQAQEHDLRLIPAISNFRDGRWDADVIHEIVTDPDLARAHVDSIVDVVSAEGWDGIDLDYEMLRSSDRDAYAAFVGTLADRLHAMDRRLTVTVQAKTADQGTADFHAAQDYEALGAAADEVRVMAYDHHWSTSDPGPIAPLGWVEDVVEYTLSRVPPEKVSLGIGAYGYDWTQGQGTDVMGGDAVALAERYAATVQWDAEAQAPWFTYTEPDGTAHTVWYENARSIGLKADLAARMGIERVFVWKLGGEQPQIWAPLT